MFETTRRGASCGGRFSAWIRAGTASLAAGPISHSAHAAPSRTRLSLSLSSAINLGVTDGTDEAITPRASADWVWTRFDVPSFSGSLRPAMRAGTAGAAGAPIALSACAVRQRT